MPDTCHIAAADHTSFAPHPMLADCCLHFLIKKLPACSYHLPATTMPLLVVMLKGAVELEDGSLLPRISITGPSLQRFRGTTLSETHFLSVGFMPGKLAGLFAHTVDEFSNSAIDVADVLAAPLYREWEERLEEAGSFSDKVDVLQQLLLGLRQLKPRVATLPMPGHWAYKTTEQLCDAFDLGKRQFERRFLATFGMTLRSYRQHQRYGAALLQVMSAVLPARTWADCALTFGYADQAHMNRDFVRFTGHTPAQIMRGISARDPAMWPFCFDGVDIDRLFIPTDSDYVASVQDHRFGYQHNRDNQQQR